MEDDVDLYAGLAEDLTAPSAFEVRTFLYRAAWQQFVILDLIL